MAIGMQQLYRDLGVEVKIAILMDATAGIAMMRRQGLGSAKQLSVEESAQAKDFEMRKVGSVRNLCA